MRALVLAFVTVALAAAGGVAWLANQMIDGATQPPPQVAQPAAAPPAPPLVAVAVADLKPGTVLTADHVAWQPWPEAALRDDLVVQPAGTPSADAGAVQATLVEALVGKTVRHAVIAGQPVTDRLLFDRGTTGFLAGALRPGHRAVAVPISMTSAASGFILPGDRVDVILSQDVRRHIDEDSPQQRPGDIPLVRFAAETVLEDVRVLAIDQSLTVEKNGTTVKGETATLEVTPEQVEALAVARRMGDVSLSLRSLSEDPVQMAGDDGVSPILGRQALGAWVGDLTVSPSLSAAIGEKDASEEGAAASRSWNVTIHRATKVQRVRGNGAGAIDFETLDPGEPPAEAAPSGGIVEVERPGEPRRTIRFDKVSVKEG